MDVIMKGLGYSVPPFIYYHFRVPKGDMHFGLRALGNDDGDVLNLAQYVKEHKLIRVYTEHDNEADLALSISPEIGVNKDNSPNEFDHGFNEFDKEANEFDLGLYQHIFQSNPIVNMEVIEQNVDYKVHEGLDGALNMEVTEEFNEMNEFNEENVGDEVHEGEENVDMRDYEVDDGIEDEGKVEIE
ncbi:unnamed protein product [Lactuca saligna]|uniref:Uncharacterized protein n=1 Tax=Lactuca saligna TaxID=75948 RepID=A0AA36EG56_LACSI|nr:unnamed protein product [Lactuca saligna]